jgi:anti-sigma B factor antagonist
VQAVSTIGGQLIGLLHEPRFIQTTTRLYPGESLLLYTDGRLEARTPDGDMLGQERLARHLAAAVHVGSRLVAHSGRPPRQPGSGSRRRHPRARTARITPSGEPVSEPILTVVQQIYGAGPIVLRVTGELDHHTAPQLTKALDSVPFTPGAHLVIDLGGVSYCDSTGITVLVTAYHRTEAAGCSLSLTGLSDYLTRVFQTVGLDQVFTVHPTVEDALAALRH